MIRLSHVLACAFVSVCLFACQSQEEIKRERYITEGILVYKNNCANCHQNKGEGLANLYPPIAKSDYLANKNEVICLIRYGQQGPILVNGKRYNRPMPAHPQLSDLEVAEVVTYIYNQWGSEKKVTDAKTVKPVLEKCRNEKNGAVTN